jgi:autotransporter-associated beta strand protein
MKKILIAAVSLCGTLAQSSAQVAAWNFFGDDGTTNVTRAATTFNGNLDSSSLLTRGAGAAASTGTNSFRTAGFQNNGISLTNTDYFQFTLSALTGYTLSLSSIDAYMAGTASYSASPGTTNQFAYSLDGTTFNLIGSGLSRISTGALPTTSLSGISDLQNVAAGTTVTFRFYATGQTPTGGWGFNSPNSSTAGLSILGTLNPLAGAQLFWDGSGNWVGTGPGSGGGGTWQDGVGSWDPASQAVFGGTAGNVTASATVTTSNGIAFVTSGYDVSGGVINLGGASSGANSLEVTNAASANIGSELSGSAGFTKNGGGTLVLSGANTFTGNATISAGTLQITNDSALGNAANDLANDGTLKTTATVALGAGRDISGSGTYDIANGTTLTVNGNMNNTATTLGNSGTLDLQGATRSLGATTIAAPATLDAAGAINVTTLTASGLTNGTANINPDLVFTTGTKTLNVATGGELALNGAVSGATTIAKTGAGTLSINNSNSVQIRVGAAGASPTDGGTVVVASAASTGSGQIQVNYGTLRAASAIVATNGLSIGGRTGTSAVLDGSDVEFQGQSSFFRGTGTSGQMDLTVNNTATFSGGFAATSGSGSATGITIRGSGEVTISGASSTLAENITLAETITLTLNQTIGGGVSIGDGVAATLGGSGGLLGSLFLGSDAKFIFDLNYTGLNALTVGDSATDTVSFGGFGIANLVGLDNTVANGLYTLIDGLATVSTNNLLNFGAGNAYDLGGGKSAYFTEGSLQVNVVPEPSTYAMLALAGAGFAGYVIRRRRR